MQTAKGKKPHPEKASRAALHELDGMTASLGNDVAITEDVIDIIGVIAGVKPSALVGGNSTTISDDLLDRLGLAHTTSNIKNIVYVSSHMETAQRLALLHEKVWGKNALFHDENYEIGRLLGYPETATDYFLRRLPTFGTPEELPVIKVKRTMNTVSEYFQSFILSPEHYKEELKSYSEPLEEATRTLAPKTYRMLRRIAMKERIKAFFKRLIGKDDIHSDTSIKIV